MTACVNHNAIPAVPAAAGRPVRAIEITPKKTTQSA